MTLHRLMTTISLAVLCGSSALAQQTAPDPAPEAQPMQHRVIVRDIQFRGPGESGPRTDLRIGPPGMWWKNPDIVQKLSLTADQQKRMDDIFQQSRLQLIDLKANVEKQELLLEPMLAANPPDTNKVLAQIDHVASARAELEKANARMLLGIRGVLSADQWTKLQTEKQEMHQRFMRRPSGPGGPGGPGFGSGGPRPPSGPSASNSLYRVFPGEQGPAIIASVAGPTDDDVEFQAAADDLNM
ncbi:MAG: Spy/CpxP family protein refolding chaperone [Acidobacteria bacterium]|nr:Spy/CpxP family protein refolding chaperone [Acidobacteriota bacterium]